MTPEELDEYIRKLVDEAPPLTLEQRDRLAALLWPFVTEGGRDGAR